MILASSGLGSTTQIFTVAPRWAPFRYLAKARGYTFVGTNSAGNNAFFVRSDLLSHKIAALSVEDGFSPIDFFEKSRDDDGSLTCVAGDARQKLIAGLPVLNVETGKVEEI